jgi:hypothetical protein
MATVIVTARDARRRRSAMKAVLGWFVVALVIVGQAVAVPASDLKDKVRVEVSSVGMHPGMDPGLYVCASNHLHIKGTVQNTADVPLGRIKIGGQAFDAEGKLLGKATAMTKPTRLGPGEKAEINVEFLTVTGEIIQQVKKHQLAVLEAPAIP